MPLVFILFASSRNYALTLITLSRIPLQPQQSRWLSVGLTSSEDYYFFMGPQLAFDSFF